MRKRLMELRKNPVHDDVDDLPDSLPLGGTTAIFLGPNHKRRKKLAKSEEIS